MKNLRRTAQKAQSLRKQGKKNYDLYDQTKIGSYYRAGEIQYEAAIKIEKLLEYLVSAEESINHQLEAAIKTQDLIKEQSKQKETEKDANSKFSTETRKKAEKKTTKKTNRQKLTDESNAEAKKNEKTYADRETVEILVTEKEAAVLKSLASQMYAEEGFSDVGPTEVDQEVKMGMKVLRGVIGSLQKKGLVDVWDREEEGYKNRTDMHIIYLQGDTIGLVEHWVYESEDLKPAILKIKK